MNVALLESNRTRMGRAAVGLSVAVASVAVLAAAVHPMLLILLPMSLVFGGLWVLTLLGRPRPEVHAGALSASPEGVRVGERKIADGPVREGLLLPNQREGAVLRLFTRGIWPIDLKVESVEHGRALLSQLGLAATQATARVYVRGMTVESYRRRSRAALGLPFGLMATVALTLIFKTPLVVFAFLLAFPLLLANIFSLAVHGRATVGTDGILVRWLWRKRFIPLDRVVDVQLGVAEPIMNTTPVVVRLLAADGGLVDELFVDCKQESSLQEGMQAEIDARAEGLVERLREVIDAREGGRALESSRALERGDRTAAEWIAHLRGLLDRRETFRDGAPPTLDELLRLVEDASATPKARAAAAVASLRAAAEAEPKARERVRVAAAASAEPRLRIALSAAAEDDDEQLEEALAALEAPEAPEAPER